MARLTTSSHGSRTYSYETEVVTRTYTLVEAVAKAGTGELDPFSVYQKMPTQLQTEVNRLSHGSFTRPFSNLSLPERCKVMKSLQEEIRKAEEAEHQPISLLDALNMAKDGKIDDLKLFPALPAQVQAMLDELAKTLTSTDFCTIKPEDRKVVIALLLETVEKMMGGAGAK